MGGLWDGRRVDDGAKWDPPMFARALPRLLPIVLLIALATPACSEDDPPAAGGASGAAGATSNAGAAGATNNAGGAGAAGGNTTGGAGGAVDPVGGATLEATVDGVAVQTQGEPQSYFLNPGAYVMARKGPNGDAIIQLQFSHSNGFPKPFVIPPATVGTERQAIVGTTSVEYWASRQGSTTTEDKLVLDGGRIKGTWTFTSKLWGNGSGDPHTVVITIDMPLHPDLL